MPILASRMKDKTFGLGDKRPFRVVFALDRDDQDQTEGAFAASICRLVDLC